MLITNSHDIGRRDCLCSSTHCTNVTLQRTREKRERSWYLCIPIVSTSALSATRSAMSKPFHTHWELGIGQWRGQCWGSTAAWMLKSSVTSIMALPFEWLCCTEDFILTTHPVLQRSSWPTWSNMYYKVSWFRSIARQWNSTTLVTTLVTKGFRVKFQQTQQADTTKSSSTTTAIADRFKMYIKSMICRLHYTVKLLSSFFFLCLTFVQERFHFCTHCTALFLQLFGFGIKQLFLKEKKNCRC